MNGTRCLLVVLQLLLLSINPAEGKWAYFFVDVTYTAPGGVGTFTYNLGALLNATLYDDGSGGMTQEPDVIFTVLSTNGCDGAEVQRLSKINSLAYKLSINNGFQVDSRYKLCYIDQASSNNVELASELLVIAPSPPSFTAADWREGFSSAEVTFPVTNDGARVKLISCTTNCNTPFLTPEQCSADTPQVVSSWSAPTVGATSVSFTASLPLSTVGTYRVCWNSNGYWHEVPGVLSILAANPTTFSAGGLASIPRRDGVSLSIEGDFSTSDITAVTLVKSADCTDQITFETVTAIASTSATSRSISVRVLDSPASVALCVTLTNPTSSAIVVTRVPLDGTAAMLTIDAANPISYVTNPAVPRGGQVLTYTFTGTGLTTADEVWFELAAGVCDKNNRISAADIDVVGALTAGAGNTVSLEARFVNNGKSHDVTVCYGKAGGNVAKVEAVGTSGTVQPAVPSKYATAPLVPIARSGVDVTFSNLIDVTPLDLQAGDTVMFVQETEKCATGAALADATQTVTAATEVRVVFRSTGSFRVCYKLASGTWSTVTTSAEPTSDLIFVYPELPVSFNTSVDTLVGSMTFRMHFSEPRTPIAGAPTLSAADLFKIVRWSTDTNTVCATTNDADIFASGQVVKLITGGAETTMRLNEGTYAACYQVSGYDYVAMERDTGGYQITVGPQLVQLQTLLPSTVYGRQTFLVELAPKDDEDALFLYGTGPTSQWCTDSSSATCRCPDPVERPSVAAVPDACCNQRWRVDGRQQGSYVLCLNETMMMGIIPVLSPIPQFATPSVNNARQGQPFRLVFSNSTELSTGSRVTLLVGVCVCSAYAASPCTIQGEYPAEVSGADVVLTVAQGLPTGLFTVCFVNGGDVNDQRHVAVLDAMNAEQLQMTINEADPTRAAFPIGGVLRAMERTTISITMTTFSMADTLWIVTEGAACSDATVHATYHGWESDKIAIVTFLASGRFDLCYKHEAENFFTKIPDPVVVVVQPTFPAFIRTLPEASLNPSVGQTLDVFVNCSDATDSCDANDQVMIVPSGVDCSTPNIMWTETPPLGTGSILQPEGQYFVGNDISITGDVATFVIRELTATGKFTICYKAKNRGSVYFAQVGEVTVYPRNPASFVVNPPAPTARELDVQFTFTGEGLKAEDQVLLAGGDVPCYAFDNQVQQVTLQVSDTTTSKWHLEVPLTDPSLNPVPDSFVSTEASLKRVCYKRNGTRWSSAGEFTVGATNPSFFEITPPRYGIPPNMCQGQQNCPHATVSQYTTVRFVFSSTSQPLAASDVIKVIPYVTGVENQCLEATQQAPADDIHYPVGREVPAMCERDCTSRQPVTFNKQGNYDVCYKLAGRTFSWMGRVTVTTPYAEGFTTPDVGAGHQWSAGEDIVVVVMRMGMAYDTSSDGLFVVDVGQPCILTPPPTNPLRRAGLPLSLIQQSSDSLFQSVEGSFDLCLSRTVNSLGGDAVVIESLVQGGLVVGPSSPLFFATQPYLIAPGTNIATVLLTPPSVAGLELSDANDEMVIVNGPDCNNSNPVGTTMTLQNNGGVFTSWGSKAAGTYTICYKRGDGAWSIVPRKIEPYMLVGFSGPRSTGLVAEAVAVAGGLTQTHTNLTLGSFLDLTNPTITTTTHLPPSTDVTLTLWAYVDAVDVFTFVDLGGSMVFTSTDTGTLAFEMGGNTFDTTVTYPIGEWGFIQYIYSVADKTLTVRVNNEDFSAPISVPAIAFTSQIQVQLFEGFTGKADDVRLYAARLSELQLDAVLAIGSSGLGPAASGSQSLTVVTIPTQYNTEKEVRTNGPVVFQFANNNPNAVLLTSGDKTTLTQAECSTVQAADGDIVTPAATGLTSTYNLAVAPTPGVWNLCYKPLLGEWAALLPVTVLPASPASVSVASEFFAGQQVPMTFNEVQCSGGAPCPEEDAPLSSADEVMLSTSSDCTSPVVQNVTIVMLRAPRVTSTSVFYICYKRTSPPTHPLTDLWVNVASSSITVHAQEPTFTLSPASVASMVEGQEITFATPSGMFTGDRMQLLVAPTNDLYYEDPCMAITPPAAQVGTVVMGSVFSLPGRAEGAYRVCYLRGTGGASVWGSLDTLAVVTAANPSTYTYTPNPAYEGQTLDIRFTFTAPLEGVIGIVPEGTGCDGVMSTDRADTPLVYNAAAQGRYTVCWNNGVYRAFDVFTVNPPNPRQWEVSPQFPDEGQDISITFTGENLAGGEAKITSGSCSGAGNVSVDLQVSSTFAVATWRGADIYEGTFKVCYKLAGSVYTQPPGPDLIIGKNPWKWTMTSGDARRYSGLVTLEFVGAGLQNTDEVYLAPSTAPCSDINGLTVTGVMSELVTATLCPVLADGSYKICYKRGTAYIEVPPFFVVTAPPSITAPTTLAPRVSEIIEITVQSINPNPVLTVESSDSLGTCVFTAGALGWYEVVSSDVTTATIRLAFASEGSFHMLVDGAAGVTGADLVVFNVAEVVPSVYSPTQVESGAEVRFTFMDAPTETAQLMVSRSNRCDAPCIPPQCYGAELNSDGAFPSTSAIQVALPALNVTLCYRRSGGGWIPMPTPFEVIDSSIASVVSCPGSGVISFGQVLSFTIDGSNLMGGDELALVSGTSCANANRFSVLISDPTATTQNLPLTGNTPSEDTQYYLCYTSDSMAHNLSAVLGASGRVLVVQATTTISMRPNPVRQGQLNTRVVFSKDVVEVAVFQGTDAKRCDETCATRTSAALGVRTNSDLGASLASNTLDLSSTNVPLTATGDFVVCYQASNFGTLSYGGSFRVGDRDPSSYAALPAVLHAGETATITFSASTVSANNGAALIESTGQCSDTSGHLAFANKNNAATFTFVLPPSETVKQYRVCYLDERGWVEVTDPGLLVVKRSEPFTVSITPLELLHGRRVSLSVTGDDVGTDDTMVVIVAGSSCDTPTKACTDCTVTSTSGSPVLQNLPLAEGDYNLCYKLSQGVFFKVVTFTMGNPSELVFTVSPANPATYSVFPETLEGGQETQLTLTGNIRGNVNDVVRLVEVDPEAVSDAACTGNVIASWTADEGLLGVRQLRFTKVIPQYASYPVYGVVCYKYEAVPWVSVPPYVTDVSDLVLIQAPVPSGAYLFPPPGRANVLNLELRLTVSNADSIGNGDSVSLSLNGCAGPFLFSSINSGNWVTTNDESHILIRDAVSPATVKACYRNVTIDVPQEVPNDLVIMTARPTSFAAVPSSPRAGQYLRIEYLDGPSATDTAVFPRIGDLADAVTLTACTDTSTTGTLVASATGVYTDMFFSQQGMYEVCYHTAEGAISRVRNTNDEAVIRINPPNPTGYTVVPVKVYAGNDARVSFQGTGLTALDEVRVVKGDCWTPTEVLHNAVVEGVMMTEAFFTLQRRPSAEQLTMCYKLASESVWNMVGVAGSFVVNAPNPSAYSIFPVVPRVRQQLTITVTGSDLVDTDTIKIVQNGESCEASAALGVLEANPSSSSWVLQNNGDAYASVLTTGTVTVCYKMTAAGSNWIAIGNTDGTSRLVIEAAHPEAYTTNPTEVLLGEQFIVSFQSSLPFVNGGVAKLIYEGQTCDTAALTELVSTDSQNFDPTWFAESTDGFNLTVCYKLPAATFAALPDPLVVKDQPVRCSILSSPLMPSTPVIPRKGVNALVELTLQDDVASSFVYPREIKFVAWSNEPNCDTAAAEPVVTTLNSDMLTWQAYFSHSVASTLRLCWRDTARNTWVAVCSSCSQGSCAINVAEPNPVSYTTNPTTVFAGQTFDMTFSGTGLKDGDAVSLHTATDGYSCSTPDVLRGNINLFFTVTISRQLTGRYHVCYAVSGESGFVQMAEVLVVSPFVSCNVKPSNEMGSTVTVQTRGLSRISPVPPAAQSGYTLISTTGAKLGFASDASCANPTVVPTDNGFYVPFTPTDAQVGDDWYACMEPATGGWAAMCKAEITQGLLLDSCTQPAMILSGQHVTLTFGQIGSSRVAAVKDGTVCSAAPSSSFQVTTTEGGGEIAVLSEPLTEGRYFVCILDISVVDTVYATQGCAFEVDPSAPDAISLLRNCDNEGSMATVVVTFPSNHPKNVLPSINDKAAVVASPSTCSAPTPVVSVSLVTNPYNAQLPALRLAQGEWDVCYQVENGSWARVSTFVIGAMHPSSFSATPDTQRAGQTLQMMFMPPGGELLSPGTDSVGFSRDAVCSAPVTYETVSGTTQATAINHMFDSEGQFYACYRVGNCPAVSLPVTIAPFHPSGCSVPAKLRAGTTFTLGVSGQQGFMSTDVVKFVGSTRLCTDEEPPAAGTTELAVQLMSSGAEVFVPFFENANPPSEQTYKVCYKLTGESYAQINGACEATILPRNPIAFVTEPTLPISRMAFNISFKGDTLLQGDRTHITTAACSALGTTDGVGVEIVSLTDSWTNSILIYEPSTEHNVCYYSADAASWATMLETITFAPSNPMNFTMVPSGYPSPLSGVIFGLHFNRAYDLQGTMYGALSATDVLYLQSEVGEKHEFLPSRIESSGSVAVFEISLKNETYTLQYIRYRNEPHLTEEVIHFETMLVYKNPYGFTLQKAADARVQQRLTLVMSGRGLVPPVEGVLDTPTETDIRNADKIRVLPVDTAMTNDELCNANLSTLSFVSPLYAASNGASKIDIMFSKPADYTVCYSRRNTGSWSSVPLLATGCTGTCPIVPDTPLSVDEAVSPPWASVKGTDVATLEDLPVQVTYANDPRWSAGDVVVTIDAADNCGPGTTTIEGGNATLAPSLDSPTATFGVRINVTGTYKFCYFSPLVAPSGEWTELLPDFTVTQEAPNGFDISPFPRAGGTSITIQLTNDGEAWQFTSEARAAILAAPLFGVVAGNDPNLCTGTVGIPDWVTMLEQTSGVYRFSLSGNKTGGWVSFCITPSPCPSMAECTRFLGAAQLEPVGMTGFTYNNVTSTLSVHGEGLSTGDRVSTGEVGKGSCVAGDLVPLTSSYIADTPNMVSDDGRLAKFPAVLSPADSIQVCYKMADQTTAAPVTNVDTGNNVLAGPVAASVDRTECTGSVTTYINGTSTGQFAVRHLDAAGGLMGITGTALNIIVSEQPVDASVTWGDPQWNADFSVVTIFNIQVDVVGKYTLKAVSTIPSTSGASKMLESTCESFLGLVTDVTAPKTAEPTATPTAQPTANPAPTPVPTVAVSDDDCSGNDICAIHFIIIGCVIVFGIAVALAAVFLARSSSQPDVTMPAVSLPSLRPPYWEKTGSQYPSADFKHITPSQHDVEMGKLGPSPMRQSSMHPSSMHPSSMHPSMGMVGKADSGVYSASEPIPLPAEHTRLPGARSPELTPPPRQLRDISPEYSEEEGEEDTIGQGLDTPVVMSSTPKMSVQKRSVPEEEKQKDASEQKAEGMEMSLSESDMSRSERKQKKHKKSKKSKKEKKEKKSKKKKSKELHFDSDTEDTLPTQQSSARKQPSPLLAAPSPLVPQDSVRKTHDKAFQPTEQPSEKVRSCKHASEYVSGENEEEGKKKKKKKLKQYP